MSPWWSSHSTAAVQQQERYAAPSFRDETQHSLMAEKPPPLLSASLTGEGAGRGGLNNT